MDNLRRFSRYIRPYRWKVGTALAMILILQAQGAVIPWLTKLMIDDVIPNRRFAMIWWVLGAIMALRVTSGVVGYYRTYLVSLVGQLVLFDLRNDLFRHLQKLSLSYYEKHQAGKILSRVMWDVQSVHQLFSSAFIQLISDVVAVIFYIAILFSMQAKLALFSILVLPLYAALFLILRPQHQPGAAGEVLLHRRQRAGAHHRRQGGEVVHAREVREPALRRRPARENHRRDGDGEA